MSAAAVATAVTKSVPPASPFAELLRRSRFASYDPAIRQTYSSPAAHAHRGDWGLKRPISLRRRNAFISLSSFESPAHFTEWNHAENQVRFIRRVEEMGVTPHIYEKSDWFKGLGKAQTDWLADSDFCPGETHVLKLGDGKYMPIDADLPTFGNRGRGQYGANRPHQNVNKLPGIHRIPNFQQMTPKKFEQFLSKLRALRPQFQQYLQTHGKTEPLLELAQNGCSDDDIKFLLHHTTQEYEDKNSHKIEQQPHPSAGLMYAHPTKLVSRIITNYQPGIVLQPLEKDNRFNSYDKAQHSFAVSFGGISGVVSKTHAGGKTPLFDPFTEQGIDRSKLDGSVGFMKARSIDLKEVPHVVGYRPKGIKSVKLGVQVVVKSSHHDFGVENPYEPGTPDYIATEPKGMQSRPRDWNRRPINQLQWQKPKESSPRSRDNAKKLLDNLNRMLNVDDSGGAK
ncbi:hypothetical protein APHAL10511_000917 [Amanita phalloides]|nr:hypothetical protein APHAL10511_000917 [Amanita phalloides]